MLKEHDTPHSYLIRSNNRTLRRNRSHLREAVPESPPSSTLQPTDTPIQDAINTPIRPASVVEPVNITPKQLFPSDHRKGVTVSFADPPDNITKVPKPDVKEKYCKTSQEPENAYTSKYGRNIKRNPKYM